MFGMTSFLFYTYLVYIKKDLSQCQALLHGAQCKLTPVSIDWSCLVDGHWTG